MWADTVASATCEESALLSKTAAELRAQHREGLTAIRFDGGLVVAHATLWPLVDGWYEIGTVWVAPTHRGHNLSAELYRELFDAHPERNILCTTTNPAAMRVGHLVEMRGVAFSALPQRILRETCCCPRAKTGSDDNVARCRMRDIACVVHVTKETWRRMERDAL